MDSVVRGADLHAAREKIKVARAVTCVVAGGEIKAAARNINEALVAVLVIVGVETVFARSDDEAAVRDTDAVLAGDAVVRGLYHVAAAGEHKVVLADDAAPLRAADAERAAAVETYVTAGEYRGINVCVVVLGGIARRADAVFAAVRERDEHLVGAYHVQRRRALARDVRTVENKVQLRVLRRVYYDAAVGQRTAEHVVPGLGESDVTGLRVEINVLRGGLVVVRAAVAFGEHAGVDSGGFNGSLKLRRRRGWGFRNGFIAAAGAEGEQHCCGYCDGKCFFHGKSLLMLR